MCRRGVAGPLALPLPLLRAVHGFDKVCTCAWWSGAGAVGACGWRACAAECARDLCDNDDDETAAPLAAAAAAATAAASLRRMRDKL